MEGPKGEGGGTTAWALFPLKTDYLGNRRQAAMVNYRVRNLEDLLTRLRRARVRVDPHQESSELGKFAWAYDLEGNRFELWEPKEVRAKRRSP